MLTNNLFVHKKLLADFSFDEVGAKEKSIKKKSAARGGRRPSTPQAFEKAWPKLFNCFASQATKNTHRVRVFAMFLT